MYTEFSFYEPDFVLLQVQPGQFRHVGCEQNGLQVLEIPFGIDGLGEGVGHVQMLQVVEVCEDSGVEVGPGDHEVVVIQNQPLDIPNLVKGFA